MPKKIRETGQGLTHHCFTKFHGGQSLLQGESGRRLFLETVQICRSRYEFELIAADIISNHIHLVIRTTPGGKSISFIMQYIKSRIAEKYNRSMGTTGAFWNDRFRSTVIEATANPEQYLNYIISNISMNTQKESGIHNAL